MAKRWGLLGICGGAVAAAAGAWIFLGAPEDDPAAGDAARSQTPALRAEQPQSEASTSGQSDAPSIGGDRTDDVAHARVQAAEARTRLEAARETLRLAELELDDLESEVAAVEQFVENIEERGDDPARYGFEGMEQLNPVIEKYEARLAQVVAAEEAVALAETAAAEADARLVRLESGEGR